MVFVSWIEQSFGLEFYEFIVAYASDCEDELWYGMDLNGQAQYVDDEVRDRLVLHLDEDERLHLRQRLEEVWVLTYATFL